MVRDGQGGMTVKGGLGGFSSRCPRCGDVTWAKGRTGAWTAWACGACGSRWANGDGGEETWLAGGVWQEVPTGALMVVESRNA